MSDMQVTIDGLRRDSAAAGGRIERLTQDIGQLRREKQAVQHNYEQQVLACFHCLIVNFVACKGCLIERTMLANMAIFPQFVLLSSI